MPLIVLEGPEGAGKTTQLAKLAERLRSEGKSVISLREPGGTPMGDAIRGILLDPAQHIAPHAEALLFMASRAQLVRDKIRPALAGGAVVLVDRFFLSTFAYQVAGRGLPEAFIRSANQLATDGIRPDLNIWLSLPVAEGLARAAKRGQADRMERADDAFHARVAKAFKQFASAKWQAAHREAGPVVPVDALGSIDEVAARVYDAVSARLGKRATAAARRPARPKARGKQTRSSRRKRSG